MNGDRIAILDTTLRDGAQGVDISFSVADKLAIVRALDAFGVDYIEAGNPASNPKELEFFGRAAELGLESAKLCAFGSTRRKGTRTEDDENLGALMAAGAPVAVIFGKAWELHVTEILRASLRENLSMIADTVAHLKAAGREVIFDAEHFFDGYADNPSYAMQVLIAAQEAGADSVCLCDTNGGSLPMYVYEATKAVCRDVRIPVGIHTHNDAGCAVANTLLAVEAGARCVQGTFIGFGERCGNAGLSGVIPALTLKSTYTCGVKTESLCDTGNRIAQIANVMIPPGTPYIGSGAFSHKAGMHADGVLKNARSFEHIQPEAVGNKRRFLISEVAGRRSVLERVRTFAPHLKKDAPELGRILKRVKEMEHFGYQFEAADASFELLSKKELGVFKPHFAVAFYKTTGEFPAHHGELPSTATVKITVGERSEIAAATGSGPVNALDIALRKALSVFYPQLEAMALTDYKVRVLEQSGGTEAKVRVTIESTDQSGSWNTVGVSADIIEASFLALADSIEYRLNRGEG